jgi:hypothetical protein
MESAMSSAVDADNEDEDPITKVLLLLKSGDSEGEIGSEDFLGYEDDEHIDDYS